MEIRPQSRSTKRMGIFNMSIDALCGVYFLIHQPFGETINKLRLNIFSSTHLSLQDSKRSRCKPSVTTFSYFLFARSGNATTSPYSALHGLPSTLFVNIPNIMVLWGLEFVNVQIYVFINKEKKVTV